MLLLSIAARVQSTDLWSDSQHNEQHGVSWDEPERITDVARMDGSTLVLSSCTPAASC